MATNTIDFDIGSGIPRRYVKKPANEQIVKSAVNRGDITSGKVIGGCFVVLCLATVVTIVVLALTGHFDKTPTPSPTPAPPGPVAVTTTHVSTTLAPATSAPADSSLLLVPIELVFRCNVRFENGTCRAVFDYETPSNVAVSVPIGADNYIEPGPPNRGQRELFKAGYHFGGATFLWNCAAHVQARWTLRSAVDGGSSVAIAPNTHVECPPVPVSLPSR